ncbi:MAG: AAA family ATPase, partial [Candidatus Hodarchaeota archaeon]
EILDKMAPLAIKEKYLTTKDYVSTAQIFQSSLKTPGEVRLSSQQVLENGIREGVSMGLFGLGELIDDNPKCVYFKESPTVSFSGNEIIIKNTICEEQRKEPEKSIAADKPPKESEKIDFGRKETEIDSGKVKKSIKLKIPVPKGKVSNLMGMMNLLNMKFNNLTIEIEATDGGISEQDYEDKIMETLRQMGVEI